MKTRPKSKTKLLLAALFALALPCALLASCENLLHRSGGDDNASVWGGYKEPDSPSPGTLTVSVRIGGTNARSAAPSAKQEFIYAASLYPDGGVPSDELSVGEQGASGSDITFMFEKPAATGGLTPEIFAFAQGTSEADLSRENALLTGKETGLEAKGTSMTVGTMTLTPNRTAAAPKGTVSLNVKVPSGCTLEIDDTTNFVVTGASPNFTIQQNGDGISAGIYSLIFSVTKGGETVHAFPDEINVLPGMCSDTWLGLPSGELDADGARVITQAMLATTLYVCGSDPGRYASQDMASDDNAGSFNAPFATIQKAIDTVIAANDGASEYTIYVDGTLDGTAAPLLGEHGMADLSAPDKELTLTIKALSGTATLDGGARLDEDGNVTDAGIGKSVIYARPTGTLNLTLERLAIKGGNASDSGGGGIYMYGGTLEITDCEVSGNKASNYGGGVCLSGRGTLTITASTISDNYSTIYGGGIYVSRGTLEINDTTISNCTADSGGGVLVTTGNSFTMRGGAISDNEAKSATYGGGGVYTNGTFTMEGGEISGNKASSYGGGVYVGGSGTLTMTAGTISGNTSSTLGGGVHIYSGSFMMTDGEISGNNVVNGGGAGVYVGATANFTMNGGTIGGDTADKGNVSKNSGAGVYVYTDGTFTMNDGKISRNTTAGNGGGVFVIGGKFTMNGGAVECNETSSSYSGGGVYICLSGTFTMSDGKISGNKTTSAGGGVYVTAGTFNMTGGTIGGETEAEKNTAASGAGVYVHTNGTFTMTGGTVGGNSLTAGHVGSGVHVGGAFRMGGAARVADTDSVFLAAGKTITVAGRLGVDKAAYVYLTDGAAYYADGTRVLDAEGVTLDDGICGKFVLCDWAEPAQTAHAGYFIAPDSTGAYGVLARSLDEIYLDSANGSDTNTGESAGNAVATLAKAVELFDKCEAQKIYVCAAYTLASGEESLLDRSGKDRLTLVRYDGSSDVSDAFTGYLLNVLSGTVTLSNMTLDGNKDNVTADNSLLYVSGSSTNVTLGDGATLCNNTTKGGVRGGGVSVYNGTFTMIGGATISGNAANYGGGVYVSTGGTFNLSGGTISGNAAGSSGYGGGVYVATGTFTMTDGEISENESRYGGGVYVTATSATSAMFTMRGGKIIGNKVLQNASYGGGVYLSTNATFMMEGGTISKNEALYKGGGVYVSSTGAFTMSGGTISGNSIVSSGYYGSGVCVYQTGTFTMSGKAKVSEDNDVLFESSGSSIPSLQVAGLLTATTPVATITPSAYTEDRQILSADGTNVTAIRQDICDQFALTDDPDGGEWVIVPNADGSAGVLEKVDGSYVDGTSGSDANKGSKSTPLKTMAAAAKKGREKIYLRNVTTETESAEITVDTEILVWEGASEAKITRSNAFTDGSLIKIPSGVTVKMEGISIDGKNVETSAAGGAIYNEGTLEIKDGAITNCNTTNNGGAINMQNGTLTMDGTTISDNTSNSNYGGGVYVYNGTFTMKSGTVSGNTAGHYGGGVFVYKGTFTMDGGTISGNKSDMCGGGVFSYGTVIMNGGTISGNTSRNGGGVYDSGTFTPNGGTISGNTPNDVAP